MAQRGSKKKIIIDGEIFEEGDPRLEQRLRQQAAPSPAREAPQPGQPRYTSAAGPSAQQQGSSQRPPAAAGRGSAGVDFSAPPLRVINVPGRPLPDLEIFALRVPSYYVLVLIYLVYAFGWRAAVAGAVLYYIWVVNRDAGMGRPAPGQRPTAAGPPGQGQSNPLAAGFADIMDTLGLGSGPQEGAGAAASEAQHNSGTGQAAGAGQGPSQGGSQRVAPGAAGATGSGGDKATGGGAFRGTGHRLGDK